MAKSNTAKLGAATSPVATTRLKKSGGSLVMVMPASARNLLHLTEGQEMSVSVEGSKVVIEPVVTRTRPRRAKYTLAELVAGMDSEAPLSDEERVWMDEPPAGQETW